MRRLAGVLLLTAALSASGQTSRIVSVSSTGIVFTVDQSNVYCGVQVRARLTKTDNFPLYQETWHSLPLSWDVLATNHTQEIPIREELVRDLRWLTGDTTMFFRVICSTQRIEETTTLLEVVMTNTSSVAVTNVVLDMGLAPEHVALPLIEPGQGSGPHFFSMRDETGLICGNMLDFTGSYWQNGTKHEMTFFCFGAPVQRRIILSFQGGTYGLEYQGSQQPPPE